ncbi:MAG: hypothetical protein PHQ14_01300 [Chromatiales bacterium]|jgi:hypothetical protein|nr:hypothetical protein [Chromatiales bacterium]MDX9766464.1 hypothetical protein [Ectothiorhodospiraceae bacterium]
MHSGIQPASVQFTSFNALFMTGTEIRRVQVESGGEPCFGSEKRHECGEMDCPLRRQCMGRLVADWKR